MSPYDDSICEDPTCLFPPCAPAAEGERRRAVRRSIDFDAGGRLATTGLWLSMVGMLSLVAALAAAVVVRL